MIKDPYEADLNILYNSQQSIQDAWPFEDFSFYVQSSADSNLAGVQGTQKLTLPQGSKPLVDVQKFPGAVGAFLRLNNIAIATRELTATITTLTVQYVDMNGAVHNLFSFDSRLPAETFTREPLVLPIILTDPGLASAGAIQLVVNASNAGASHVLTYDVYVSVSVIYLLREKNELLRALHKHHTLLSDLAEAMKKLAKYVVGV